MPSLQTHLQHLHFPLPNSHKGQNGKLMIVGGSELFHAASKWSLDVASRFVDMVFYASVPSNNQLVQEAKGQFWNGIVVPRIHIEDYMAEADCVLIGPGMDRLPHEHQGQFTETPPTEEEWNHDTAKVTNYLVKKYASKKWVIDAGALQMIDLQLLNEQCVITPHQQEFLRVYRNLQTLRMDAGLPNLETGQIAALLSGQNPAGESDFEAVLKHVSILLGGTTLLIKGVRDVVVNSQTVEWISGGNAGMTKGGTGDVLAGLVAGLYTTNPVFASTVVASAINKKAGDTLYQRVGPNFNASDLAAEIPVTLWSALRNG